MSVPKLPASACLDNLVDLASRTGIDVRQTLLRVLTDLYIQKPTHSPAEAAQFVELASHLIEVVDPSTRSLVAARLAVYPAAPAVLLQRLVDFGALPHLPELSAAPRATTAAPAVQTAAAPTVSAPARTSPAANELAVMFFKAAADERRSILLHLGERKAAAAFAARPDAGDVARRLEAAALQRNAREFAAAIERGLSIGVSVAEMITNDATGEPIVVVAKALGMRSETLQRILMFLNPKIGQSAETVYRLNTLFHEIDAAACAHLVDSFRDAGQRRAATHQPQYYDDETSSARASATPGQRPAAARGAPLTERFRGAGR
jgi:uncharacterized protein (DUF2336 family)